LAGPSVRRTVLRWRGLAWEELRWASASSGQSFGERLAGDDLDGAAVRVGQAHDLAAARRGIVLHRDAFGDREALEILDAVGLQAQRREAGIAERGLVHERRSAEPRA
jgi:hypothetical protein